MAPDSIQVIIPALNEEATIGAVVAALRAQGLGRIRVVDNGSTDGTAAVAGLAGAAVLHEPVPGYGRACWRGYRELGAEVRWVLFCDADGSDDLKDVARLLAAADGGADLVLGDRRARAEARAVMTPVQNWGNGLATTLIRWGWGHRYGDLGPLRLIRRDLLENIAMQDRGFGWTIEMQVRAVELGASIVELPVGYARRRGGRSKISGTVRGSVQAGTVILATLAKVAWRRLRRWRRGGGK
jgi:glycosyltransferase involved in cell wall biosynthesis